MDDERLHIDIETIAEIPIGADNATVTCFRSDCVWRGKICDINQVCSEDQCPVRAYFLHLSSDSSDLSVYGACLRFQDEWPRIEHGEFSVVPVINSSESHIHVWYAKGRENAIAYMPEEFEGFRVIKEVNLGVKYG